MGTPRRTQPFKASSRTIATRSASAACSRIEPAPRVDRRAGAGERHHREPADLGIGILRHGDDRQRVGAQRRGQGGHRHAAEINRVSLLAAGGDRAQPLERRILERQELLLEPSQGLEAARGTGRGSAVGQTRAQKAFRLTRLLDVGVRDAPGRAIHRVTGRRGDQRIQDGLRLLGGWRARQHRPPHRQGQGACGLVGDFGIARSALLGVVGEDAQAHGKYSSSFL